MFTLSVPLLVTELLAVMRMSEVCTWHHQAGLGTSTKYNHTNDTVSAFLPSILPSVDRCSLASHSVPYPT